MARRIICSLLGALCLIAAFAAAWQLYSVQREYDEADAVYDEIALMASVPKETEAETDEPESETESEPESETESTAEVISLPGNLPNPDWKALQDMNPDIIGWIWIDGTQVSYPVVQGSDNSYYLKHLTDGSENSNGSIFMDCTNEPGDDNLVLYGHHMRNGSMFENITEYKEQSFYDDHSEGWYLTPEHIYRLDFFSAYECSYDDEAYMLSFGDSNDYAEWLIMTAERSDFRPLGLGLGTDDKIMTLSTCDYDWTNARYVVHAKMIEAR